MDFLRRHRARIQAAGTVCAALAGLIGLVWLTELLLPLVTWTDLYEIVRLVVVALLSALLAVRFGDRRAYRKGDQDGYQRGHDIGYQAGWEASRQQHAYGLRADEEGRLSYQRIYTTE